MKFQYAPKSSKTNSQTEHINSLDGFLFHQTYQECGSKLPCHHRTQRCKSTMTGNCHSLRHSTWRPHSRLYLVFQHQTCWMDTCRSLGPLNGLLVGQWSDYLTSSWNKETERPENGTVYSFAKIVHGLHCEEISSVDGGFGQAGVPLALETLGWFSQLLSWFY